MQYILAIVFSIILSPSSLFSGSNIKNFYTLEDIVSPNNKIFINYNNFTYQNIQNKKVITDILNPKYKKILNELVYLHMYAIASIHIIGVLPNDAANWSGQDKDHDSIQDLITKHSINITKGPVYDDDGWMFNYVGHPITGSYYYIWGRQSGLTWQESAALSVLMSTFFWEYGWESTKEPPSIQDLIITPLFGSILGELTNSLYNRIIKNDGKIYGSKIFGSIAKVILDPIGESNKLLNGILNNMDIKVSTDYSYVESNDKNLNASFKLNFSLQF